MTDSETLLSQYKQNGSEPAFRELVSRYVGLVYSTALRLVNGDRHLAQDVSQAVFMDLAVIARRFSKGVKLGGWLHRHTCFLALKTMRRERRRQAREREAVEMNSLQTTDDRLRQLAPVLDEAINELAAADRTAIVLRFFEQRDLRTVGATMGTSENAAQKRISRALDTLHGLLKRRGVMLPVAALGAALTTDAVSAAPATLAATISPAALAHAASSVGSLTLLKVLTMTKLKLSVAGIVVATGVAVPLVVQHQSEVRLRGENQSLRRQIAQFEQVASENERLSKLLAKSATGPALADEQFRELLRLRGEVGRLREENKEVASLEGRVQELTLVLSNSANVRRVGFPVVDPNTGYAVNPSPAKGLFTRIIKVDPNTVIAGIRTQMGADDTEAEQQLLRRFLVQNGVNLEPPESLFFDNRAGSVVVRAALTNVDSVELLLAKLNVAQ